MLDTVLVALLAPLAFGLGAVPFSVIVGRRLLGKDIRRYGDGNPGAVNVFRAGSVRAGFLAVVLDVVKGFPVVFIARAFLDIPVTGLVIIGLAAILGHAFSPFLHWRGGKAIAVTFGVLLAMPRIEVVLSFAACVIIGALFIDNDAWGVTFAAFGALFYQVVTRGVSWEPALLAAVLAVFVVKHFEALHQPPGLHGRLYRWIQSNDKDTPTPG